MKLKINSLQHIGLPVSDIEVSKSFYKTMGFEDVMSTGFVMHGEPGKVTMMKLGDIIIELYQLPEPELGEIKTRGNGHIDHIAFDVDDVEETYASLKNEGYSILEDAPVYLNFWTKGCRYFNIVGPDGERLEFNQIL